MKTRLTVTLLALMWAYCATWGQDAYCPPRLARQMQTRALIKIRARNTLKHPRINAHRGNQAFGPENSLPAFIAAGKTGAWAIETDFRMTKDGVVVCHHDAKLDRTTTGTGYIKDYTLEELRKFRIKEVNCVPIPNKAYRYGDFSAEELRIPTMDEYFEICKQYGCVPFIELKEDGGVIREMMKAIKRHGLEGSCIISAIPLDLLVATRQQGCMEMIHHIFSTPDKHFDTLLSLGNVSVSLAVKQQDLDKPVPAKFDYKGYHPKDYKDAIHMCHKLGFRACFRAADSPEAVRHALKLGADCMPANYMWVARMKEK